MKTRLVSIVLVAVPLALAAVWSSARLAHATAAPEPVLAGNAAIAKAMQDMNAALEVLSKGVNAANKDASLAELLKFETAVLAAKGEVPSSAEKVEEKKRAAFVAEYRKTLLEALKHAADAEAAIVDGKFKDADKLIGNKLSALKSAGHSKFKTDGGGGK
jgi:hypothetical protein